MTVPSLVERLSAPGKNGYLHSLKTLVCKYFYRTHAEPERKREISMASSHKRQKDTKRGGRHKCPAHRLYTLAIASLAGTHLTPWRGPADDYVGFIARLRAEGKKPA